jgi:hypothetical protein
LILLAIGRLREGIQRKLLASSCTIKRARPKFLTLVIACGDQLSWRRRLDCRHPARR